MCVCVTHDRCAGSQAWQALALPRRRSLWGTLRANSIRTVVGHVPTLKASVTCVVRPGSAHTHSIRDCYTLNTSTPRISPRNDGLQMICKATSIFWHKRHVISRTRRVKHALGRQLQPNSLVSAVSYPMSCQATTVTYLIRAISGTVTFETTQVAGLRHLQGRTRPESEMSQDSRQFVLIDAPFRSHILVQDDRYHRSAYM
jgi:hypothetical protein